MSYPFTPEQVALLKKPLSKENVKQRKQNPSNPRSITLSYIEGWHAIAEANRIFGYGAWSQDLKEIRLVSEKARKIGRDQRDGWGVSYVAIVSITLGSIVREGVGSGHGTDADLGMAHESAIKEAATDAMKRALMTFGDQFGLALYEKEQSRVTDAPPDRTQAIPPSVQPSLVATVPVSLAPVVAPSSVTEEKAVSTAQPEQPQQDPNEEFLLSLFAKFEEIGIDSFGIDTLKKCVLKIADFGDLAEKNRPALLQRLTAEYAQLLNQGKNSKGDVVNRPPTPIPSLSELENEVESAFGD